MTAASCWWGTGEVHDHFVLRGASALRLDPSALAGVHGNDGENSPELVACGGVFFGEFVMVNQRRKRAENGGGDVHAHREAVGEGNRAEKEQR